IERLSECDGSRCQVRTVADLFESRATGHQHAFGGDEISCEQFHFAFYRSAGVLGCSSLAQLPIDRLCSLKESTCLLESALHGSEAREKGKHVGFGGQVCLGQQGAAFSDRSCDRSGAVEGRGGKTT